MQFGCVDTQYPQFKGSRPFASLPCVLNQPGGGESEFSIMWIPHNLGQVALTAQPSPFVTITFLKISWNCVCCWMTFILPSQPVCTFTVKGTALLYDLHVRRDYFARGHGGVREIMIKLCPLEYAVG